LFPVIYNVIHCVCIFGLYGAIQMLLLLFIIIISTYKNSNIDKLYLYPKVSVFYAPKNIKIGGCITKLQPVKKAARF